MNKKRVSEADKKTITFEEAVKGTPEVSKGYSNGLQALKSKDKDAVKAKDVKKLNGSVDIDTQTAALYPNDSRWDYAIGYDSEVFYVEVHPASTSNVSEVVKKKSWLQKWLKSKAPLLDNYPNGTPKFLWAATAAGVHILKTSTEYRKVAQMNLIPRRPVEIG